MTPNPVALGGPAAAWRERGEDLPSAAIRVLLADVDGVITRGEGKPAEIEVLRRLEAFNCRALEDPLVPAIALCTGRQAPYVELMAQVTGVFLPCIFEHGSGLFFPRAFRYAFNPLLGDDYSARLAAVRAALETPLLRPGRAFVQPGKEASMTLYPLGDTSLDEIVERASAAIEPLEGAFTLAKNVQGVELRPRGVDKGTATEWLAREIGIPLTQLAGVGDSDTDLVFLERVAFAAAPANATPAVREAAEYVAKQPYGRGLIEIVERVEAANRRLVGT